jgi:PTS system ascorbate-specific IIA component
MSVGIILITHQEIGDALLDTARQTFGELPLAVTTVAITYDTDIDALILKLTNFIRQLDNGDGILALTDMFGATPCNLAMALEEFALVKVVCGLNPPMLIKILNYPQLPLHDLVNKAICGGKDGVIDC